MPSTFDPPQTLDSVRPSGDEGSRLRRNALSFVAFLVSPLQMSFLSRALGAEGFGRWWWTFVVLELTTLVGMQGADLYVRRELPGRIGDREAMHRCLGSALALAVLTGSALCALQIASAHWVAQSQDDPELALYLAMLAIQPVLANISAMFAAALQSVDAYGGIALLRGLIGPLTQVAILAVAWRLQLTVPSVLAGLVAMSLATMLASLTLYLRHFDLRATIANALRPRELRAVLDFGLPLLLSNALWTAGGKIDLYLLRPAVGPAVLGVYVGCLQLVSSMPNTRAVFDPVVQQQIAALRHQRDALAKSLQRLARLSGLALLPFFVGLVTVGEPVLSFLLGRATPDAALPIAILSAGQFLGGLAVASWLAPMLLPRRALTLLAAGQLIGKVALLHWLAPWLGSVGAAIAAAAGTVFAQQGMALLGARALQLPIYSRRTLRVVLTTSCSVGVAALLVTWLQPRGWLGFVHAALIGGACTLLALLSLLDKSERDWLLRR